MRRANLSDRLWIWVWLALEAETLWEPELVGEPEPQAESPNANGVYSVRVPAHAAAIMTLSNWRATQPARLLFDQAAAPHALRRS